MVRKTAAAVVVFVFAAVVGTLISPNSSDETATTPTAPQQTTTAGVPRAFFVDEDETVVGPAVIVADTAHIDGTQLVVSFDIATLAPTADSADVIRPQGFGNFMTIAPEDLVTVFLDDWQVTANGTDIPGTVANPSARAARFEVGSGFDLSSIERVEISSYALLTPVSSEIALAAGSESAPVAPGITARLLAVTEQANTIVQVELTSDREFNLDNLRVTGAGPGWLSAVREAEGRPRWNLTFDSETAPSPILMEVEGSVWMVVDVAVTVTLGEPE